MYDLFKKHGGLPKDKTKWVLLHSIFLNTEAVQRRAHLKPEKK